MSFVRLRLLNTSGETAPPFAIAEVADAVPVPDVVESGTADADSVLEIRKPTGSGRVCAVGPAGIADDRYGKGFTGDCFVRFTGDDPSPGDTLKATAGSWALSASGTGTGVTVAGDIRTIGSGETAYKVVRVQIGGGPGGGTTLTPVVVYDNLTGGTSDSEGLVTLGATSRCLPVVADGAGWAPDLTAEFIDASLWSLASLDLSESGCCGGDVVTVPTGPRITYPIGEGGINRVATGDTAAGSIVFSGTGAVPGESLTVGIQAINPTTGATTGSELTPTVTNNGDGTWTAASADLSALGRSLFRVYVTNDTNKHYLLFLWSDDEWDPTSNSNGLGIEYFDDKPNAPDLQTASDTGTNTADNVTDDDTPSFSITFEGNFTPASNTHGLVYLVNQSTGAVTVVTGTATDFDSGLTITKTVGSALADGVYEVQAVVYLDLTGGGYTYNTWYGPPSNPLRVTIVADASAVETPPDTARYSRLGLLANLTGIGQAIVGIDKCRREITADEITKLDS